MPQGLTRFLISLTLWSARRLFRQPRPSGLQGARSFGRERTDLSAQRRRKRLIAAERCMGDDATPDGFGVFLNSCGLEGIIVDENPNSRLITIYIGDTLSPGEKRLAVQKIAREIPAHLSARLIFACDDSTVDI